MGTDARALPALLFATGAWLAGCSGEDSVTESAVALDERPDRDDLEIVLGTSVRMAPPKDFSVSEAFPGYVHMRSGTSIMVNVMPAPYSEIRKGFDEPAALAKSGMTLIDVERRAQGPHPGELVRLSQKMGRIEVEKWIWAFGNEETTVMILGTCSDLEYLPVVRESILTARWDPDREVDVSEGLGFEVDEVEGLVFWERMGNLLAYTSDGEPDLEKTGKPMFTIGPAMISGPIGRQREFAEMRVRQLPLDDVEIRSVTDVEIDGLGGCEVLASARQREGDGARSVLLVVLFEQENYWIAYGVCESSFEDQYFPKFRQAAVSLRRDTD